MKKMRKIKQNKDLIVIILFALIISISLIFGVKDFINLYVSENLNSVLLPIFGVFLGGLITSYTVLVALSNQIPITIKETKAYRRINKYFLVGLYSILLLIILNISFYFTKNNFLLLMQVFLSILSIFMIAYLILIIHKLFLCLPKPIYCSIERFKYETKKNETRKNFE